MFDDRPLFDDCHSYGAVHAPSNNYARESLSLNHSQVKEAKALEGKKKFYAKHTHKSEAMDLLLQTGVEG